MATHARENGRDRGLVDLLLVPRPLLRILLIGFAFGMAELAFRFLPQSILVYGSGVLTSFCLLVAGAIWALRDRLDDAIDGEHLSAADYAQMVDKAERERRRFTRRAAATAVLALLCGSTAISDQLTGDVWHWMVLLAGFGAAEACYGYMLANRWEEQIRALRSKRIIDAKRAAEKQRLLDRLEAAAPTPQEHGGWTHGHWGTH